MKEKKIILLEVLALVLLLAVAFFLYSRLSQSTDTDQLATLPTQTQGQETQPDETEAVLNTLKCTVYNEEGMPVKLADYVGKPIALNFWASWCGPCKSEMPEFQAVYEEMGEQVQFLMVNATVDDTMDSAKAFIQQEGYTFPVLYDVKGTAVSAYDVSAFPTTYFLDKEGNPVGRVVGAISKETLLKGIDMIKE